MTGNDMDLLAMKPMDKLVPLPNKPLLTVEDMEPGLIVGDLHVGIEYELGEQGLITSKLSVKLLRELTDMIRELRPRNLYLLGDVKHTITHGRGLEQRYLTSFFQDLLDLGINIYAILGNHDGGLDAILPPQIQREKHLCILNNEVLLTHGHSLVEDYRSYECIVMGHIHPAVYVEGQIKSCWLKTPRGISPSVIVIPAYNPYAGYMALNKKTGGRRSPLLKEIDMGEMEAYLPNGFYLGKVGDISGNISGNMSID